MSNIEGDDSEEEEEDSNEVDEEKYAQSDYAVCDDANSGDGEEEKNVWRQARKNPLKSPSKQSCVDQTPKDWFSLVSCLLWSVVHLSIQMIDWRALKLVMGQPFLMEEGLQKENVKLVRKWMIDCMIIQTQEDAQPIKCSQVRLCNCSSWLVNKLLMNKIAWLL